MYYSEKENWAFIHIPKNAGTTFIQNAVPDRGRHSRKYFENKGLGGGSPHHNKYLFFKQESDLLDGKEVFAFVRNPWSRALSLYLFTLKHCKEHNHDHHARLTMEGFKRSWMPDGFFRREPKPMFTQRRWLNHDSQKSWLVDENGDIVVTWYKIETDLQDVEKKYDCDMGTKVERTATSHGHYSQYYDDELETEIGSLFAEDVEAFNYEFVRPF